MKVTLVLSAVEAEADSLAPPANTGTINTTNKANTNSFFILVSPFSIKDSF